MRTTRAEDAFKEIYGGREKFNSIDEFHIALGQFCMGWYTALPISISEATSLEYQVMRDALMDIYKNCDGDAKQKAENALSINKTI